MAPTQTETVPKLLIVGGPDVDARIDLMHSLQDEFEIIAIGSMLSLRDKFASEGFDFFLYNLNRNVSPISDLRTFGELFSIFRRLKPQIVHAYDTKPCVWARLAARAAGVPIIIGTLPGLGSLYSNNGLKARITRMVYEQLQGLACRLSDLTIFQNHHDEQQFVRARIVSRQKTAVISGSGIRTDHFSPSVIPEEQRRQTRESLGVRPDQIVVIMISRIIKSKGVLEFQAAAEKVQLRCSEAYFLLVGPEDKESIDHLTSKELAEFESAVTWLGQRSDIRAMLAASDIFVLPSGYREGVPRVLLEAASMALPLVTSNSPGCIEVVENDVNGFLISVGDSESLEKAITDLVQSSDLRDRFGKASRSRAIDRFDISEVVSRTRSLYGQMLISGEVSRYA